MFNLKKAMLFLQQLNTLFCMNRMYIHVRSYNYPTTKNTFGTCNSNESKQVRFIEFNQSPQKL